MIFDRLRWGRDPLESLRKPWRGGPKDADVFVSYKSENAQEVRAIVETLAASGVRVWFAEHQVLLGNWEDFERAIQDGIRRCEHAVIFSNDRFAGSDHCRNELAWLFGPTGPGPGKIIEIKLPNEPLTHREQPALAGCRSLTIDLPWTADKTQRAAEFIASACGLRLQAPVDATSAPSRIVTDDIKGHHLDLGGWDVVSSEHRAVTGTINGQGVVTGFTGPSCRRTLGGRRAELSLIVGCGVVAPVPPVPAGAAIDERASFDGNRAFAREYFSRNQLSPAGLHLYFTGDDAERRSHLALSYWHAGHWTRRYSIILPDPLTGASTEFAFVFSFHGSWAEFCGHVGAADRVVHSLTWPKAAVAEAPRVSAAEIHTLSPEILIERARQLAWRPGGFWTAHTWCREAFDRMPGARPARPDVLQNIKRAALSYEHTDTTKAIAFACEATALAPEDPRTWRFAATILQHLGQYPEAVACAERSVAALTAATAEETGRCWAFVADTRYQQARCDWQRSLDARLEGLRQARAAAETAARHPDGAIAASIIERIDQAVADVEKRLLQSARS